MALSRREAVEIKSWLTETVKRRLGYSESAVVNAALQCLQQNLDKDSACQQLSSLLDDLAPAFVNDLFSKLDRMRSSKTSSSKGLSHKKRTLKDVFGDELREEEPSKDEAESLKRRKKTRFEALKDDNVPLPPAVPEIAEVPLPLNSDQISAMVATMKKEIEQRKSRLDKYRQRSVVPTPPAPVPVPTPLMSTPLMLTPLMLTPLLPTGPVPTPTLEEQHLLMNEAIEKAKKAADLHSKIQAKVKRYYYHSAK